MACKHSCGKCIKCLEAQFNEDKMALDNVWEELIPRLERTHAALVALFALEGKHFPQELPVERERLGHFGGHAWRAGYRWRRITFRNSDIYNMS